MKKTLSALALSLLASTAFAAGSNLGALHVTGQVTQSTCQFSNQSGVVNKTVELATVATNELSTQGAVAGKTAFTIDVLNCPQTYKTESGEVKTQAYITFNGVPSVVTEGGNLKNKLAEGSNVAVQILNNNNEAINLAQGQNNNGTAVTLSGVGSTATLNFSAQYIAETGAATSGQFSGSVPLSIAYK